MRWPAVAAWLILAAFPGLGLAGDERPAAAQAPETVTVTLKGGSTLIGTIVEQDADQVKIVTSAGVELQLPRASILSMGREAAGAGSSDPNDTRLMFAPTARSLAKGDGYFSDHYVLFPGFSYGVTDHVSLSGGMSVVPAVGIGDQLFYASTKAGWSLSKNASLSVGALLAGGVDGFGAGILFGIGTFGSPEASITAGIGFGATREDDYDGYGYSGPRRRWRFREAPILMIGGSKQLSKHSALVSETWIFTGKDFKLSEQPIGLALRLFGDRLSADVGFILVGEVLDEGFPIPWLSVTYQFGPSHGPRRRSR